MTPDLRHYLREATAEQHHQLDSQPALRRLMRPGLTLADYSHTLACLGAAFRHVEAILAKSPLPENTAVPAYLPRYPAITRDLTILQLPLTPEPDLPALPSAATSFTTLGIRYVVDGSSQGSVHILRKLSNNLPELTATGAQHYWHAQERAGQDWPGLCRALMQDCTELQRQQALNGACWAFKCFTTAFENLATATDTALPAHPPG